MLTPASAQSDVSIEFKDKGQIIWIHSLDELAAITAAIPLKVFEVHENTERVYRALPARPVFDKVFGKDWEKAQEIVFTSFDGYQPHVPVTKFLSHDAYFAIANEDDEPFTLTNRLQNNEVVALGPLYLVWDNMHSKALREAGASDMPYQINRAELKFETPFLNMSPPPGSSEQVQRGFAHFRKHCAACHTINGEGGGKGPELNYPASVAEYMRPEYLKRWIESPQSIRYNTTMPGLAEEIPDREKITEELIAYLKAMSAAKRNPENIDQKILQSR